MGINFIKLTADNLGAAHGAWYTTKCAYGKSLARQMNAIPLPGGSGNITKRMKYLENGIRTQEGARKMPRST